MNVYQNYPRYYDILCQDKDHTGEARFFHALLQKHSPNARSILELNCGTGYRAALLAESEYQIIHGIDSDSRKIDRARQRLRDLPATIARKLRFDRRDIPTLQLPEKFDAVITFFPALDYPEKIGDLLATLTTASEHLKTDGSLVLDCWYGPGVLRDLPAIRVKRLETEEILIDRVAGEPRETSPTRYVFRQEIDYFFARSGLRVIDRAGWMNEKIAGFDTWGIYFIGQRTRV